MIFTHDQAKKYKDAAAERRAKRDQWFKSAIDEAKDLSVKDVLFKLGIHDLRAASGWYSGPCFECGGTDRFNISIDDKGFFCRHDCGVRGGDMIALTMQFKRIEFKEALELLVGGMDIAVDPKVIAERKKKSEANKKKQDAYKAKARKRARKDASVIWRKGRGHLRSMLHDYFELRGITYDMLPELPDVLRLIPDHPYVKKIGGQLVTAHRGPCMIGLIQSPDDRGAAVHQTWIDLTQDNGKARITYGDDVLPSKMVRGSKKGGAIRLHTPLAADTLVMGEGIETTMTALAAQPIAGAAYWCAVDLGNMSGRMQRGKGKRFAGLPDMSDTAAFVPPAWVRRLVFIMDGDSEPRMTRAKLESGLRRAMAVRPGLVGQIVEAGVGVDLNDVLKGGGE